MIQRGIRGLFSAMVVVLLSACAQVPVQPQQSSFQPLAGAGGVVSISFWVEGRSNLFLKYQANLDRGTVSLLEQRSLVGQEVHVPIGALLSDASNSPDKRFSVSAAQPAPDGRRSIRIYDRLTGSELGQLPIGVGASFAAAVWNSDSSALAILIQQPDDGFFLYPDALYWISGHGVSRSDFELAVFSTLSKRFLQVPIQRNLPFASHLLEWTSPGVVSEGRVVESRHVSGSTPAINSEETASTG